MIGLLGTDDGWIDLSGIQRTGGADIYTRALYRSLTQPAATKIHARTTMEKGLHLRHPVRFTTTMHHLHAKRREREAQDSRLRSFFVENHVDHVLGSQVSRFLHKYYFSHTRRSHEDDLKFFRVTPLYLRNQLRGQMRVLVLVRMPFLEQLSKVDAHTVHSLAHTAVFQSSYHGEDVVFSLGDLVNGVWFMLSGKAENVHGSDTKAEEGNKLFANGPGVEIGLS